MNTDSITETNGANSPEVATLQNQVANVTHAFSRSEARQQYSQLVSAVREIAPLAIPAGKIVLVISKGDEELLDLRGPIGWHFPRAVNGMYAGGYPANSREAIGHLEELRSQGAEFLLIPSSAFWWLEYYAEFTSYLQQQFRVSTFQEDICIIYRLDGENSMSWDTRGF